MPGTTEMTAVRTDLTAVVHVPVPPDHVVPGGGTSTAPMLIVGTRLGDGVVGPGCRGRPRSARHVAREHVGAPHRRYAAAGSAAALRLAPCHGGGWTGRPRPPYK